MALSRLYSPSAGLVFFKKPVKQVASLGSTKPYNHRHFDESKEA